MRRTRDSAQRDLTALSPFLSKLRASGRGHWPGTLGSSTIQRRSEVKQDTGIAGVAGYIRPGDPVVPFATHLTVAGLARGSHRLEVRAAHSADGQSTARSVDFDEN
jgi:hypothetical protein